MPVKIIEIPPIVNGAIGSVSAIMRLVEFKQLLKDYGLFPIFLEGVLQ